MKTLIIIPAYNEAEVIAETLKDLRRVLHEQKIKTNILVNH